MSRLPLLFGLAIVVLAVPAAVAPAAATGSAQSAGRSGVAVPRPALEPFEAAVQEQLRRARAELDALLAGEEVAPEEAGRAFGEVGRLYLLYDLSRPAEACFLNAIARLPGDFRWPHYLGYLFQMEGRFDEALRQFERVLALRPDYVPALVRYGGVLLDLSRPQAAQERFERALSLDPENAAAHYGLGRVAYDLEDYAAAVEHFEAALRKQPQAGVIRYRLGMAFREQGDLEAARHHLAQSQSQPVRIDDPLVDGLAAFVAGGKAHFHAGVDALREGRIELAIDELRRAIEVEPEDYLAHYNLAVALEESGDPTAAETALRKSLTIHPNFRNAHFNLATLAAEAGRYDDAAAHFEAAYRIDPQDSEAQLQWATALSRIGQPERAREVLEQLVQDDPGDYRAQMNLGTVLAQLGRTEAAAETWRRLLEAETEPRLRAEAHLHLGVVAEEQRQLPQAIEHYRRATAEDPQWIEARHRLAGSLGRAGRYGEAAAAFAGIVERRPLDFEAHFGQAMALILGEEYRRARAELEESLTTFPGSLPLRHVLARLLAACPDPGVRDGAAAVKLARSVFEAEPTLEHAETLAMALAEGGDFAAAASWQSRVVAAAEGEDEPFLLERARRRLALYEAGRPVREPWKE